MMKTCVMTSNVHCSELVPAISDCLVAAFGIQEYVNERVKKIGGMTSFNLYIMKELEVLYKLLVEIKTTLQVRIIMYKCISLVI